MNKLPYDGEGYSQGQQDIENEVPFICSSCKEDIEECLCDKGTAICRNCKTELEQDDMSSSTMEWGEVCNYKCPKCGNEYMQSL